MLSTANDTWCIPSPLLSRNLAMGLSGEVGSRSSILVSPMGKKATRTFCSGTSSSPASGSSRNSV